MNKITTLILIFLLIGVLYRLLLTANGNFFFNMDNGRDMVDVREMVVLHKARLIGPTSAIEGFYNGPAWYYLLSIPFILSGGDPYASIFMEIILWAIGGFFLMKIVSKWGNWLIIPIGSVWVASDYIVLANRYAFNPNPVTLLTPVLVYFILKYIEDRKIIFGISAFLLGGLFFNFEMNIGIFIPLIIFTVLLLSGKGNFITASSKPRTLNPGVEDEVRLQSSAVFESQAVVNLDNKTAAFKPRKFIKTKSFWIGVSIFILTLLPQVIFDIKHNFLMSKSVINFLQNGDHPAFNIFARLQKITASFYEVFTPVLMHKQFLLWIIFGLIVLLALKYRQNILKNTQALICFALILIPFLGYLLLPINVNLWHLGAEAVAFLILTGFVIKTIWDMNVFGKIIALFLGFSITLFSILNMLNVFSLEIGKKSSDPSLFKNEVATIDYVYQKSEGKNFKVYTYLPSVYDYPYQYLFWWYGNKKYGFIPGEYAYSPNKPQYISNKEKFEGEKNNFSGLVFLIKEPDRINMRVAWENDFKNMKFISKEMVGPLEVEIREEVKIQ